MGYDSYGLIPFPAVLPDYAGLDSGLGDDGFLGLFNQFLSVDHNVREVTVDTRLPDDLREHHSFAGSGRGGDQHTGIFA